MCCLWRIQAIPRREQITKPVSGIITFFDPMQPNRSLVVTKFKTQQMRLFLIFSFLAITAVFPTILKAQDAAEADTVDLGFIMRKEKSMNVMLHTLGYGFGARFGNNKTYYKNRMFEFDLLEMRAPNQARRYNENFANPRSYVYGKLNSLYIVRAGIGRQVLMNRKPYWGGVEVRGFYYGGLDLGIAKPTFLYIAYYSVIDNQLVVDHISLERYNPDTHFPYIGVNTNNLSDIYGRGPILSGFSSIKIYPGLYVKGGFNFEFSAQNDKIKAVEAGVAVDVFPMPVPIMAFSKTNYYFLTGYLSFHFGKRYN
jgi:hypothetical protein